MSSYLSLVPGGLPQGNANARSRGQRRQLARQKHRSCEAIRKRLETLKSTSSTWREHMRECYELFHPQHNPFWTDYPGQKRMQLVFDSTPMKALKKFASRVHGALIPSHRKFCQLVPGAGVPEEVRDRIAEDLEKQTDILFEALNNSNLATAGQESIQDLGIGTGCLLLQRGIGRQLLQFEAVCPGELEIEEGPDGTIQNVYRQRTLKCEHIEALYRGFKFSEATRQKYSQKADTSCVIIEACIYNEDTGQYDFIVFEEKEREPGFVDAYNVSPWIIFRWSVAAGEHWGRGPAMDALPDAKTLNRVKELVLRNAAIAVAGIYKGVADDVLNPWTVVLEPGAVIPVAEQDSLEALGTSHDFTVSDIVLADLRESINDMMLANSMGPVDAPKATATEILERRQELMRDAGPAFGRLYVELVTKVVRRAVDILQREGVMAPIMVDGQLVDVKQLGPLAAAQDEEEVLKLSQAREVASMFGEEAVQVAINAEAAVVEIFEKMGVSKALIRGDAERQQVKQQVMELAARMEGEQAA